MILPALDGYLPVSRWSWLRHDLSYGVYIWAFPVQQLLAFGGLVAIPVLYVATSVILTLVMAALSWFLIERPALALKAKYRSPRTASSRGA